MALVSHQSAQEPPLSRDLGQEEEEIALQDSPSRASRAYPPDEPSGSELQGGPVEDEDTPFLNSKRPIVPETSKVKQFDPLLSRIGTTLRSNDKVLFYAASVGVLLNYEKSTTITQSIDRSCSMIYPLHTYSLVLTFRKVFAAGTCVTMAFYDKSENFWYPLHAPLCALSVLLFGLGRRFLLLVLSIL